MDIPEKPKQNISRDLIRIHMIISRGTGIALERGQDFLKNGFPDERMRQGYRDYVGCLVSVIDAHHLAEDDVAFPQLGVKIPAAPYKLLAADHQKMTAVLAEIRSAMDGLMGEASSQALGGVLGGLKRLRDMWFPHINIEETHFTPEKIEEVMGDEEQGALSAQMGKYSQEHTSPNYLIIPFLLFNLPPAERDKFAQALPPVITEQLVPHAWKEQWQPMQPFLLT